MIKAIVKATYSCLSSSNKDVFINHLYKEDAHQASSTLSITTLFCCYNSLLQLTTYGSINSAAHKSNRSQLFSMGSSINICDSMELDHAVTSPNSSGSQLGTNKELYSHLCRT